MFPCCMESCGKVMNHNYLMLAGTSPGLLSGDLVSYECEADYGFADDPNLFATTVECMPDGTVTTHNPWPECLFCEWKRRELSATKVVYCNNHDLFSVLWNAWEPWSTCSETCGNGVYVRSRTCGHPLVTCADLAYNVQYCNEAQCTNAENGKNMNWPLPVLLYWHMQ